MDAGRDFGAFDQARVSLRAESEMLRTHCTARRQSSGSASDAGLDDDDKAMQMRQGVVDAQLEFVRCRDEARVRDAKRTLRLGRSERSALRALGLLDERTQRGQSRLLLLAPACCKLLGTNFNPRLPDLDFLFVFASFFILSDPNKRCLLSARGLGDLPRLACCHIGHQPKTEGTDPPPPE